MLKRFVYVLRNAENPPRYYTGLTSNVSKRHAEHNAGTCIHSAKHRPWVIDVVIEFADEDRAVACERYLKSGSGVAFARGRPPQNGLLLTPAPSTVESIQSRRSPRLGIVE